MSALDQAFIKAYSHRAPVGAAARMPAADSAVPVRGRRGRDAGPSAGRPTAAPVSRRP